MDTGVKYMLKSNMKNELKEVFNLFQNQPESLSFIAAEVETLINENVKNLFSNKDLTDDIICIF